MRGLITFAAALLLSCVSPLEQLDAQSAGAFRRCWPSLQPNYCTGSGPFNPRNPRDCQRTGEREYAEETPADERPAWLTRYGCPSTIVGDQR